MFYSNSRLKSPNKHWCFGGTGVSPFHETLDVYHLPKVLWCNSTELSASISPEFFQGLQIHRESEGIGAEKIPSGCSHLDQLHPKHNSLVMMCHHSMESNLNITGPNWSAFPYQFPHGLGPSHGFARQNSSGFFGIPCLNWPPLAKKSLEESATRTVYPMVFGFARRKCWNIMEHLLPSAFRTTALRPQKRNVSVRPVDFIPYDTTHSEGITGSTLPVRASKMLHFFT
jgi:hypothetical protein